MALINSSRVYLESFVRQAASIVPVGSNVLDAGAGDCQYKFLFEAMNYESADFCQVDKPYGEITYVGDLNHIPVPDNNYDLVLCTQVLEHVTDPQAIVAELFRVLKPGGVIYASAPLFYEEHEIPYDFFRYTRFGLEYIFQSVGFSITQIAPLEGYFGALSYQFDMASKMLHNQSHKIAEAYGSKNSLLLRFLAPVLGVLARKFARMDLDYKMPATLCKNYTVIARKQDYLQ